MEHSPDYPHVQINLDYINTNMENRGTGFWAVVQSVLAAAIGVQSRANRERDFTHGKPIHFIVGGLIGTFLFIIGVWLFVQLLIRSQ